MTAVAEPCKLLHRGGSRVSHESVVPAVQSVGQLFSVPHSRKRKKYLESLEAGMDLSPAPGGHQVTSP